MSPSRVAHTSSMHGTGRVHPHQASCDRSALVVTSGTAPARCWGIGFGTRRAEVPRLCNRILTIEHYGTRLVAHQQSRTSRPAGRPSGRSGEGRGCACPDAHQARTAFPPDLRNARGEAAAVRALCRRGVLGSLRLDESEGQAVVDVAASKVLERHQSSRERESRPCRSPVVGRPRMGEVTWGSPKCPSSRRPAGVPSAELAAHVHEIPRPVPRRSRDGLLWSLSAAAGAVGGMGTGSNAH